MAGLGREVWVFGGAMLPYLADGCFSNAYEVRNIYRLQVWVKNVVKSSIPMGPDLPGDNRPI